MSKFITKQGQLVQKAEFINFPNKEGTITKLPTYCVIPVNQGIPNDISDNKKYPNVYMVNHVVYAIGYLKNGKSEQNNCTFYKDCISTNNQTDIFELPSQQGNSLQVLPLHKQQRKQQLTEYILFTESGLFKAVLMACNMPNAKKFLSESVSLLQDIKQNNVQLTGFTEDSRIKKLIKDNDLSGIMDSIMDQQRDVLDIRYGKTEFMNKLSNYTDKSQLIEQKKQELLQLRRELTSELQMYARCFVSDFLFELSELDNKGLKTQIQQERIAIDGHIYSKEISLEQIQQTCEMVFQEVIGKISNEEAKAQLRRQLDLSYKDIETMNKPKYIGQSRQTSQDREKQHNDNIMSIMDLEIVKREPKYLRICCLLLDIQERLPQKIQRQIGRIQPCTVFKTNILDEGIDNQETLNILEKQRIHETPNNINTIKYITYDNDANHIEYQKILGEIAKYTNQIQESSCHLNGLRDAYDTSPNVFIKQTITKDQKDHIKLINKLKKLNTKKEGIINIIEKEALSQPTEDLPQLNQPIEVQSIHIDKLDCSKCNREFKSQRGLQVHQRTCNKK